MHDTPEDTKIRRTKDCYLVCCFSHDVPYSSSVCVCLLLYILLGMTIEVNIWARLLYAPGCRMVVAKQEDDVPRRAGPLNISSDAVSQNAPKQPIFIR